MRIDPSELEQIYRHFAGSLYRRCRRILRNDAAADDAVQQVFIRLMRYGADTSDAIALHAWLNRVADRCCYDLMKRDKRYAGTPQPHELSCEHDTGGASDARLLQRDIVLRFWHRLDARLRAVAIAYFVDELSQDEVAQQQGCTRRTVYADLKRIARKARRFNAILEIEP